MSLQKENAASARLLHITDTHLSVSGTHFPWDDHGKVTIEALNWDGPTREELYDKALGRIAEHLTDHGQKLGAVVFSGDALSRGPSGGDQVLLEALLRHLRPFGIEPPRIVAVPGNHDIQRGTTPSTEARYDGFIKTWRNAGCVTPWLDGVDKKGEADLHKHVLIGEGGLWAIVALNSCNWSQTSALTDDLRARWDTIPGLLSAEPELQKKFKQELDKLRYYDMARVSEHQFEVLRLLCRQLNDAVGSTGQLRILVMHHHLRAPDHTEEVKQFSDVTNLERLRTFIAQQNIAVVMHGHKHVARKHFDHIEVRTGKPLHRVLMLSGGSTSPQSHLQAMNLVSVSGLPWVPHVKTTSVPLPRDGLDHDFEEDDANGRLWPYAEMSSGAPVVVQGHDYNQVYERAKLAAAAMRSDPAPLIVHLDLANSEQIRQLPDSYPRTTEHFNAGNGTVDESAEWLSQLVDWWQTSTSQMRSRVPYRHGERLKRFAQNINQLEQAKKELEANGRTTRALALLIDPAIDFVAKVGGRKTEFASFVLVQFRLRSDDRDSHLDCIAYYRAQEISKWWPVNVAELRHIQLSVAGKKWKCGRITTIAAEARFEKAPPSDVAVPIIDRWVDQAPHKLFIVAHAMLAGGAANDQQKTVATEWLRCLKQLAETAKEEDGARTGVTIEGPSRVAEYLKSVGNKDSSTGNHAKCLEELVRVGKWVLTAGDNERGDAVLSLQAALQTAIEQGSALLKSLP
ncbi:metallophosphoesterase family protein [Roseateles sp. DC23W]|uniref:Metallophosphoesterase family protein n=1 Tax=Pelomonas dachongensis TaxID=3299029 RepID=A0ABW7EGV2_9BURK